jgi:hypothetical protein
MKEGPAGRLGQCDNASFQRSARQDRGERGTKVLCVLLVLADGRQHSDRPASCSPSHAIPKFSLFFLLSPSE